MVGEKKMISPQEWSMYQSGTIYQQVCEHCRLLGCGVVTAKIENKIAIQPCT